MLNTLSIASRRLFLLKRRDIVNNFNYDSYCGIYCGACSILKAYQTGYKDKFASFWKDEKGLELKCNGCKTDTVFTNCANCKIRSCAINKNVERCIDCNNFPCNMFSIDEHNNMLVKLPHLKGIPENLMTIKKVGANQWLAEQDKQWKCPECKTEFSWYTSNCSKCGKDLEEIKGYESVFDKTIFDYLMK